MSYLKLVSLVVVSLFLTACSFVAPYEPPQENEPHALVKLKFKYSAVHPGSSLGARMHIRQDPVSDDDSFQVAFNESYGAITDKKSRPEIPMGAVKVHPGKKTDINMAVYFYWYTTQTQMIMVNNTPQMQTYQVYHERACTVQLKFEPVAGKVYLLDYSSPNIDRDCRANAYEQKKQGNGKFKLLKVGTSKAL